MSKAGSTIERQSITYRCFTCGAEMSAADAGETECGFCRKFREKGR
jgi:DNA-directed RNA polymerase subunit RPC12/RpoP